MLTKKELLTLILTFALLFGLGALIYLPIVQKQLVKNTQAKLAEAGYADLSVSFRGQDATVSGAIKGPDDLEAIETIVKNAAVPISFRTSGKDAVRVVDTSALIAPESSTPVAQTHQGEPFVTVAAYNRAIRVDGSVANDSEKKQLADSLRTKYKGFNVDASNVSVSYAHSPASKPTDVSALPAISGINNSFFAGGNLNGKWQTFPGRTLNANQVEQKLVEKYPKHDHPLGGLKALLDFRDKKQITRSPPRANPTPSTTYRPAVRSTSPTSPTSPRPIPKPAVNLQKPSLPAKPTIAKPTVGIAKPAVATKLPSTPLPRPNVNTRPGRPSVSVPSVPTIPNVSISKPAVPPTFIPAKPVRQPVRPPVRPQTPIVKTPIVRPVPKPIVPTTPTIRPVPNPVKPTPTAARAPASQLVGRLTFETGKSTLSNDKMNYGLRLVKNMLSRRPNAIIQVIGHTDNVGAADANRQISRDRAAAVRDFLVAGGVKKQKILFTGKGETEPIADNNTADGRGKNRRVDIIARY